MQKARVSLSNWNAFHRLQLESLALIYLLILTLLLSCGHQLLQSYRLQQTSKTSGIENTADRLVSLTFRRSCTHLPAPCPPSRLKRLALTLPFTQASCAAQIANHGVHWLSTMASVHLYRTISIASPTLRLRLAFFASLRASRWPCQLTLARSTHAASRSSRCCHRLLSVVRSMTNAFDSR